ncbi:MAG: pyridoxine 5'-phosphate synthase [Candidatus Kapabacteria bacterium]|jgi:pyridoxine 5-phosphate synthase|nr:pyridoxine 5'-phosphate synthase [Candidatus Kapabacteria bacterium]
MITLNINVDHVATLRNARGGFEPDPVTAAVNAELAGATGIVAHLREDRRHMKDRDIRILREVIQTKLDLEMAANEEIIAIALDIVPELVTIVPENRKELTTEGGLNLLANIDKYRKLSDRMHEKDIEVSFFIEPDEAMIEAALECDADMVEFHTGIYANAKHEGDMTQELARMIGACSSAFENGLKIAAGHGLNYSNVQAISMIPEIDELSIGHSVMARAIHVGISQAVREMHTLIMNASMQAKLGR